MTGRPGKSKAFSASPTDEQTARRVAPGSSVDSFQADHQSGGRCTSFHPLVEAGHLMSRRLEAIQRPLASGQELKMDHREEEV